MENEEKEEEKEEKTNPKTVLAFTESEKKEAEKRKERPKTRLRKGSSVAIFIMFSLSFLLLLSAVVLQILSIFGYRGIQQAYNTIVIVLVVMVAFSVLLAILLTKIDKNHTN